MHYFRQGCPCKRNGRDGLPPRADQEIPLCQLKVTFLGVGVETAVRLGFKSWFADVELSTSNSIWGLLSLFL